MDILKIFMTLAFSVRPDPLGTEVRVISLSVGGDSGGVDAVPRDSRSKVPSSEWSDLVSTGRLSSVDGRRFLGNLSAISFNAAKIVSLHSTTRLINWGDSLMESIVDGGR